MCGICGTYNFDGRPAEKDLLKRMCDLMVHRGPDSEGFYTGGRAFSQSLFNISLIFTAV